MYTVNNFFHQIIDPNRNKVPKNLTTTQKMVDVATIVTMSALTFFTLRFRIALPTQYIVKTGLGISSIQIAKATVQWPFQEAQVLSMQPMILPIAFQGKSKERVPFELPMNWTIGPKDDPAALTKYATKMLAMTDKEVKEMIQGIVSGDARVITAGLSLDELFSDRDQLKKNFVDKVDGSLQEFGLSVYNANISELKDIDDKNSFFEQQKRRTLAEKQREGDVAEKTNDGEARQKKVEIETSAVLVENTKAAEQAQSKANLEIKKADLEKITKIAQAEANAAAEQKTLELQKNVEEKRQAQEIERLRAQGLASANVEAEIAVRKAEGDAKSIRILAEADLYKRELAAKAALIEMEKQAEGIRVLKSAESEGLQKLISAAGSGDVLNKYLLVANGTLPELAGKQAEALKGLNPKVNIWTTGGEKSNGLSSTLTDLFKTGMPLFDGIKEQTGYDFLGSLNVKKEETQPSSTQEIKQIAK